MKTHKNKHKGVVYLKIHYSKMNDSKNLENQFNRVLDFLYKRYFENNKLYTGYLLDFRFGYAGDDFVNEKITFELIYYFKV